MSTVYHYKSNLRDILFNLFECNRVQDKTLQSELYNSLDEETVRETMKTLEALSSKELAESFADSDRVDLKTDEDGMAILPDSLKKSIQAFYDGGWHLFDVPQRLGGIGAPPSIYWAGFEMITGSNPAAGFYFFGIFIARCVDRLGTEEQKARFVQATIDNLWGGTMVLTEPGAGSDVGAGRAKARHIEGDLWEIEGTKRFITNGDYDVPENIIHTVLARPEGAEGGTKGLSMFIVPKFWVNEDGSLGERNGVYCSKVEKKMGLKASATCEMVFGGDKPARGFLLGNKHGGIRQMFHVIEQARMAVGIKSMATLSTAYYNALEYTKERIQGPDLTKIMDKSSPRVPIIQHPDVRRMLMLQKAHAEGLRALAHYAAFLQDQVEIVEDKASEEGQRLHKLNDLLLPMIKGYGSEKAYELLSLSLQCYGGSGYCQDFPIEQYIRDQKIDTLYEGTTQIQALDLFFRKIMRDGGDTMRGLLKEIKAVVKSDDGGEALAPEKAALGKALDAINQIAMSMMTKAGESLYHVGFQGNRILFALSETVIGWLLVKQSIIAHQKRDTASASDKIFYESKIATVRYYCHEVLPKVSFAAQMIEAGNIDLMEMSEELF